MKLGTILFGLATLAGTAAAQSLVVAAEHVYTAAGDAIEGGFVAIADGKIVGVGPGVGSGSVTGDERLEVHSITPGLIDLSPRIDTGAYSVEQTDETPIDLSVGDALDLFSYRWGRELRSGVTSVLASPADLAVIGGLSCVLKTGGAPLLEARLLNKFGALRASMGSSPSSGNRPARGGRPINFYTRRPTTRMGVEWQFRQTFYDALAAKKNGTRLEGIAAKRQGVLDRVLAGDLPVLCQAWPTQDIRTACYLKEEFGIEKMILDGAAEAWREPELLVRSGCGVVLPPYVAGRTEEGAFYALDTAAKLHELGVPLALSGHGGRDHLDRLMHQPGWAMRGGLPFDAALRAVTITPARMVGVDSRVGSLEVGKDADLVLWSGPPFEPSSHVIGVVLNGELVVDPRGN
ncbi:MAG: amidohydrolase family protein [Planctomycetota bacterium]